MSQIVNALLDRAGTKTGNKKRAIQLHIQDGYGQLTGYFNGVQADSTMQITRDGTIYRLLQDNDVTWTNGDWAPPFDDTREFVRRYKYSEYAGNLLLTVELEGRPGDIMPEAQYKSLLWLCQYWTRLYKIPANRDYIIRHSSCGEHKYCPGPYVDDNRLFADLAKGVNVVNIPVPPVPGTAPNLDPNGDPAAWHCVQPGLDFWVVQPLLDYWRKNGGLSEFGYPLTSYRPANDNSGLYVQYFERARLEYNPQSGDITRGRVAAELLAALGDKAV